MAVSVFHPLKVRHFESEGPSGLVSSPELVPASRLRRWPACGPASAPAAFPWPARRPPRWFGMSQPYAGGFMMCFFFLLFLPPYIYIYTHMQVCTCYIYIYLYKHVHMHDMHEYTCTRGCSKVRDIKIGRTSHNWILLVSRNNTHIHVAILSFSGGRFIELQVTPAIDHGFILEIHGFSCKLSCLNRKAAQAFKGTIKLFSLA